MNNENKYPGTHPVTKVKQCTNLIVNNGAANRCFSVQATKHNQSARIAGGHKTPAGGAVATAIKQVNVASRNNKHMDTQTKSKQNGTQQSATVVLVKEDKMLNKKVSIKRRSIQRARRSKNNTLVTGSLTATIQEQQGTIDALSEISQDNSETREQLMNDITDMVTTMIMENNSKTEPSADICFSEELPFLQEPGGKPFVPAWKFPKTSRLAKMCSPEEAPGFKMTKTKWWNPFYKRTFDSNLAYNTDCEGMTHESLGQHLINEKLYKYLIINKQPYYPDRKTCLIHMHKLALKHYEVAKIAVPSEDMQTVRRDMLTISRATDEKDTELLYSEAKLLKPRGFLNALKRRLGAKTTTN